MIPLNKSCFTDYSTDLPGPNIIKGINGNTKVLGIGTITLTHSKWGRTCTPRRPTRSRIILFSFISRPTNDDRQYNIVQ